MVQAFRFKQFSIEDSLCAMKVGIDAVLLGAWIDINNEKKILDIGTGTGIIALMIAQKSNAMIDAVEIDIDAYKQAKINITNSAWYNRIKAYHISIQDYALSCNAKYDLIVTNPPYFINSYKAPIKKRHIARHNDLLSHEDIINSNLSLLEITGRFCIILPFNEGMIFKSKAALNKFYCNKITYIKPKKNIHPNRLLMEFSYNNNDLIENELIIEDAQRHHYTSAYKELTRDYYLAF